MYAYIVHQKVKGKVYTYEAESYWDNEKKQPRQRRRYLGVVDENGNIVEKKFQRDIKSAKDYGPAYLLDRLAGELQLRQKLLEVFGPQGEEILALAMAKVIRLDSLRNIHAS